VVRYFTRPQQVNWRATGAILASGVALVAVVLLTLQDLPGQSTQRFSLFADFVGNSLSGDLNTAVGDTSSGTRVQLFGLAVTLFEDRPILGVGPAGFEALSPRYLSTIEAESYPHNAFLQFAAEYGLVGLTVFVVMLCLVVARSLPRGPAITTARILFAFWFGSGLVSGDVFGDRTFWGSLVLLLAIDVGRYAQPYLAHAPIAQPSREPVPRPAWSTVRPIRPALEPARARRVVTEPEWPNRPAGEPLWPTRTPRERWWPARATHERPWPTVVPPDRSWSLPGRLPELPSAEPVPRAMTVASVPATPAPEMPATEMPATEMQVPETPPPAPPKPRRQRTARSAPSPEPSATAAEGSEIPGTTRRRRKATSASVATPETARPEEPRQPSAVEPAAPAKRRSRRRPDAEPPAAPAPPTPADRPPAAEPPAARPPAENQLAKLPAPKAEAARRTGRTGRTTKGRS
jgi:hypothetical protein